MVNRTDASRHLSGKIFYSILTAVLSISATAFLAKAVLAAPIAQQGYDPTCGSMTAPKRVPPSDYRQAPQQHRDIVEKFHFHEHYMAYLAGKKEFQKKSDNIYESPAAGFNYTLWAFPNHAQALAAMEDLGFRDKTEKPQRSELSVHCYFQRAIKFAPDDALVRTLYGYYFARRKQANEARAQFSIINPERADTDQNIQTYMAWAYISIGDLDAAVAHATKAYRLGLGLPGLAERLAKLGRPLPSLSPNAERTTSR